MTNKAKKKDKTLGALFVKFPSDSNYLV